MDQGFKGAAKLIFSSVGRKFVMALSGLALIFFIISHVVGNLQLYFLDGGDAFNRYAHSLFQLGDLLYVIEGGLAAVFIVHIAMAIGLHLRSAQSRPESYHHKLKSKKGEGNRSNLSSRHMLFTGLWLLVFLIIHIAQFRLGFGPDFFNPPAAADFMTSVDGVEMRNLYGLVKVTLLHPGWMLFYLISMVVLAFHIRHGFWSLFQSLGWPLGGMSSFIYLKGTVLAVLIAAGFFFIPLWLWFTQ